MMQIRFTRFAPQRERHALPEGASATELAIGQLLGLAMSAGFRFDVVDGMLVPIADDADFSQLPVLNLMLGSVGPEAVICYFERNAPQRHEALSASA